MLRPVIPQLLLIALLLRPAVPAAALEVYVDFQPPNTNIEAWLSRQSWMTGTDFNSNTSEAEMTRLATQLHWQLVLAVEASDEARARQAHSRGQPVPNVTEALDNLVAATGGHPEQAAWKMFVEDDSFGDGIAHDMLQTPPSSHAEALNRTRAYLRAAMDTAASNKYPTLKRWGRAGFASTVHLLAELGLDMVIVERANEDIEDLQTALAFLRGAAQQHNTTFGLDLSLWWGCISGCVQDLPASFHARHFTQAFFAGARAIMVEGGDLLVNNTDGSPYELGRELERLGAMLARAGDPGRPHRPVAVLLPPDHGWITPAYWRPSAPAFNFAFVRNRPAARALSGLFAALFPGSPYYSQPFPFGAYASNNPPASPFALSAITPPYAPHPSEVYYAESTLPFGTFTSRTAANQAFQGPSPPDPAPSRPMADTRYGGIIDVLTTAGPLPRATATSTASSAWPYQLLVLADQVELTADLEQNLTAFAASGGQVVVAAGVATPSHSSFTGLQMDTQQLLARRWRWNAGQTAWTTEHVLHVPAHVLDSSVVVRAQTADGSPLLTTRPVGSQGGAVHTCLVPWFNGDGATSQISAAALALLDVLIEPLQEAVLDAASASGPLAVQTTTSDNSRNKTLVLTNNDSVPWQGGVLLRRVGVPPTHCVELIRNAPCPSWRLADSQISVGRINATVPPFSTSAYRWWS